MKSNLIKIRIYDNNHKLEVGDKLNVELSYYDDKMSYDTDFDNNYYLYSKGISYSAKLLKKEKVGKTFSINIIKYKYNNYLKSILSLNTYNYINTLVFGNNTLNQDIKDSYSYLGLSHILAISGLHIIILFKIISFILLKLFHYYRDLIPIFLVSVFVILFSSSITSYRALLFLILNYLNKKGSVRYSKLDILSISMILMLIYNPFIIYNTGFILSYIISFIIIFKDEIIKTKYKLLNIYLTYILIYFSTLPFVINITNNISILSLLLSPILSLVVGYLLIPLSYLIFIIPILDYILKYIYEFLNIYVYEMSNYTYLIHIKSFNIYLILAYYILFIFLIIRILKNKYIISLILYSLFLLSIFLFKFINPIAEVTFIDCGQGDSSLIKFKNSEKIVVIDLFNSYNFLKNEGIDRIDYLIITHSDMDHYGDFEKIINYFDVSSIIYPYSDIRFNELLNNYNNKYEVRNDKLLKINDDYIEILAPINKYDDPNSNSIVLKLKVYDYTFMYTGDATNEELNDILNYYDKNKLKSDVLKVAHHGSNTSYNIDFYNKVNPKYSIISVAENNKYNLPNIEVCDYLNKYSNLYMTKDCGNITFNIYKDKMWISKYR